MTSPRYRLTRKIATGGMAEVFLALQQGLGGFEKLVVVKRILPHLSQDGQFVQMFLEEAKLAAALSHPNIVEIFDIQRDEQGFLIAMEYLSGEDVLFLLKTFAERKERIPVPVTCRIISHAAAGLMAAHESTDAEGQPREVVHRDVSPSNLIVTYEGTTKLVDFGVAKANVANIYTRPGTLKGKLSYSSPEQVQHKHLDGRSDIFSLGIVAWQLLTGCKLFDQPSAASKVKAVMEDEIPPPSTINDQVPQPLDEVVLGCLERDRRRRIQSAAKLRSMLGQVNQEMGWGTSGQEVGEWMCAALSQRKAERLALEREVILDGRELEAPPVDVTLPPFFPGAQGQVGAGATTPSAGAGTPSVAQLAQPPRVGRIVLATVAVTLVLVLLAGFAFWMGSRTNDSGPGSLQRVAVLAPLASDFGVAHRQVVATPLREPDAGPAKMVTASSPDTAVERALPASLSRHTSPRHRAVVSPRRNPRRAPQEAPATGKPHPAETAPEASRPSSTEPAKPEPVKPEPPKPKPAKPEPAPAPAAAKPTPAPPAAPVLTHGTLRVTSDAAGYLFVDGENTGLATPARIRLPVGSHEVVVLFKGTNLQVKQQVRIKPGKVIKIRLRGAP